MGVGKINVYITALGQPCKVDNANWVVAVAHCDGSVLNWSEGRYKDKPDGPWIPIAPHVPPVTSGSPAMPQGWYYDSIPANNGHVEIEVPPGCYVVTASKHTWTGVVYDSGFWKWVLYGNWATEHAIVTVGCSDDVCATLYAPTVMNCWNILFNFLIPLAVRSADVQRMVKQEDLKAVQEAARVLDEKLFKPLIANGMTTYEQLYLAQLKRVLKSVETK
jgi:hypothetical protein